MRPTERRKGRRGRKVIILLMVCPHCSLPLRPPLPHLQARKHKRKAYTLCIIFPLVSGPTHPENAWGIVVVNRQGTAPTEPQEPSSSGVSGVHPERSILEPVSPSQVFAARLKQKKLRESWEKAVRRSVGDEVRFEGYCYRML